MDEPLEGAGADGPVAGGQLPAKSASTRVRWLVLFSLAVVGGLVLLVLRHQHVAFEFQQNLRRLSPLAVLGALCLVLVQVTFQSLRMWAVLPRDTPLSVVRAAYVFTVGDWTNIFIPARGGDALKVVLINRTQGEHRIPLAKAAGAMLADKVVDISVLCALSALTGLMSLLLAKAEAMLPVVWKALGAAAAVVVVLAVIRRGWPVWWAARTNWLRDLPKGLSTLRNPAWCLASVSFSVAARFSEVLAISVLCYAMDVPLSPPSVMLAILIVNMSVSIPVSFANLGVYEAGLAYGLTLAGMPLPVAIVVAATHHALELLGISIGAAGCTLAVNTMRRRG
jgi:uncharacterized membrane protein YbhN (UPF0104 family)